MAPDLAAGLATTTSCAILAGAAGVYAVAVGVHAWAGLRNRFADCWSAAVATVLLLVLAWAIWNWGPQQIPSPMAPALLGIVVLAAVGAPAFTAFGMQDRLDRLGSRLPQWMRWRLPDMSLEDRRKGPHLVMGIYMLVFPILGHWAFVALASLGPPDPAAGEGWGNVAALAAGPWLAAGQVAACWLLLMLAFVLLPVELLRLRDPSRGYPFKRLIEPRLREREKGLFGAHLYIAIGVALAVLWLGQEPTRWPVLVPASMAMVAVTVFADAASALAGIRWGRRRWFHNTGKSYVGTAGGALVALAFAIPLVGVLAGTLAAAAFVAIDAVAPRPIPVSDNLLNPAALAALFWALRGHVAPLVPLPA